MQKKKTLLKKVLFMGLFSFFVLNSVTSSAASMLLKKGSQGNNVVQMQKDLKTLGFFSASSTGYYGSITSLAVKNLQKRYGLYQDGIAGKTTFSLIDKLLGRSSDKAKTTVSIQKVSTQVSTQPIVNTISRGGLDRYGYLIPWFGGVENVFSRGEKAEVLDVDSGLSFNIMRTYGYNHADCETLTPEDTKIMKNIYNGQWSWDRRAIIVTVNGVRIAASMAGMPHAGDDSKMANTYVNWRSEGYGYGENLDTVKGNNMDGHFDIHFLGSKTHGTNVVNQAHQNAVKKAAAWAEDNL